MTTINIKPLLQRDYGEAQDCTLVSILTLLQKEKNSINLASAYSIIESAAKKYLYNGEKWGTFPLFIKQIMKKSYESLGIKREFHARYAKGIGYNFNTVKNLIDRNIPIVLSMFSDGVGKYSNHSVVIIGYDEKTKEFIIYDNWTTTPHRIKYNKICVISCINWAE